MILDILTSASFNSFLDESHGLDLLARLKFESPLSDAKEPEN